MKDSPTLHRKRSRRHGQQERQQQQYEVEPLGALEFCAALNGDDGRVALSALRRFVKIVRKERRMALLLPCEELNVGGDSKEADDGRKNKRRKREKREEGASRSDAGNNDDSDSESQILSSDDEDDCYSDLGEEDYIANEAITSSKKKRRGQESWKADTQSYNVPFVGTSVVRGSTGTVRRNEWPCGLLEAYLQASPFAIELTGTALIPPHGILHRDLMRSVKKVNKKQSKRASDALCELYLRALAELVTAAIPLDRLKSIMLREKYPTWTDQQIRQILNSSNVRINDAELPTNDNILHIISTIMKDRFPGLLQLINAETNTGSGKHGFRGGGRCGPLTRPALVVLTNLTSTSMGVAREVARGLDEKLREGVLQVALKSFPRQRRLHVKHVEPSSRNDEPEEGRQSKEASSMSRYDVRSACLRLATALLETNDVAIASYAITPGSRERKMNPGIVYLAMRIGLNDSVFDTIVKDDDDSTLLENHEYLRSIKGLLRAVRVFLLPEGSPALEDRNNNAMDGSHRQLSRGAYGSSLSTRVLADLFSGGVIDRLTLVSSLAPPLTEAVSYKSVLSCHDSCDSSAVKLNELRRAALEGRRLVFLLLADKMRSPFLVRASNEDPGDSLTASYMQLLTRSINAFVSSNDSLAIRAFVVHCVNTTPELLPQLFRTVPVLEPKATFRFLSSLSFLTYTVRNGPSVLTCLGSSPGDMMDGEKQKLPAKADRLVAYIMPTTVTKNILSKAVQSTNGLLVFETLKLIIAILGRAWDVIQHFESSPGTRHKDDDGYFESLEDALQRRLPDLQALLAIRSKFNPFVSAKEAASHSLIVAHLCEVIRMYGKVLPRGLQAAKFDWFKLLPADEKLFLRASPALQWRVLSTLQSLALPQPKAPGGHMTFSSKAFNSFLSIMIATCNRSVYDLSRKLAILAISRTMGPGATKEAQECLQYETSLWVDGASEATLPDLAKLFDMSQKLSFRHAILAAQAWRSVLPPGQPMPQLCFSPLLTTALAAVGKTQDAFSQGFCFLTCQVTVKCLLYHLNPTLLAAVVCYFNGKTRKDLEDDDEAYIDIAQEAPESLLFHYARALVFLDDAVYGSACSDILTPLLAKLFGKKFTHVSVLKLTNSGRHTQRKSYQSCLGKAFFHGDIILPTFSGWDVVAILRQCLHQLVIADPSLESDQETGCHSLLRIIASYLLQDADTEVQVSAMEAIFGHVVANRSPSLEVGFLALLALGHPSGRLYVEQNADTALLKYLRRCFSFAKRQIESMRDEDHLPFSESTRMIFLLVLLFGPLCPQSVIVPVAAALLQMCENYKEKEPASIQVQILFGLALKLMKCSSSLLQEGCTSQKFPVETAFRMWTGITEKLQDGIAEPVLTELCHEIELILIAALDQANSDGLDSSLLYLQALKISPEHLIQNCFATWLAPTELYQNDELLITSFISRLLEYDCLVFAPPVLKCIASRKEDSSIQQLWENGDLDAAVSTLVVQLERQKCADEILATPLYYVAMNDIVERAKALMEAMVGDDPSDRKFDSFRSVCSVLPLLFSQMRASNRVVDDFIELLADLLAKLNSRSLRRPNVEVEDLLLQIASSFLSSGISNSTGNDERSNALKRKKLATVMFVRLCWLVPRTLRKKILKKESKAQKTEHDPRTVLSYILDVLPIEKFDDRIIESGASEVQSCVFACLKYGVTNGNCDNPVIPASCLRLVCSLVTQASMSPSSLAALSEKEIFDAAQIHSMIVSHSKFSSAFSEKGDGTESTECKNEKVAVQLRDIESLDPDKKVESPPLELARLLVCCVSLAGKKIEIERETLSAILSGYNAGLSRLDRSLRRLLHLYENVRLRNDEKLETLHLDELQWGRTQDWFSSNDRDVARGGKSGDDHGGNWEWFINLLDESRVQAALAQFPPWDTLEPPPMKGVEVWETGEYEKQDLCDDDNDDDDDDDLHSNYSTSDAKQGSLHSRRPASSIEEWQGNGIDIRYSPAFVLPLILGVLETFHPPQGSKNKSLESSPSESSRFAEKEMAGKNIRANLDDSTQSRDDVDVVYREKFAKIAKRLSDKGGISLALATLSSKCPSLRQVAVATLAFFMQALNTKEARELTTWRERPQLALVLNSVQRGLAVRRAIQISRRSIDSSQLRAMVPMMPTVSAVFLAKATLVITKPGHAMFGQMNRFFLRLEEYHGAYKDCFRLPAFMTLFCSTSEDPGQARRERLWALQLLKDGIVDDYSFRAAARCHAPSLLLTSFDAFANRRAREGDEVEQGLLLDTLASVLKFGGKYSSLHLIGRVGLMSWIRAILSGRALPVAFPTVAIRSKFLRLLNTTLNIALGEQQEGTDVLRAVSVEVATLARPIVDLHLDTIEHGSKSRGKEASFDELDNLRSAVCRSLWMLQSIFRRSTEEVDDTATGLVRPNGLSIQNSLMILDDVQSNADLYSKAVESICCLPLSFDEAQSTAADSFCHKTLSFVMKDNCNDELVVHVLQRVRLLSSLFVGSFKNNRDLVRLVVACRRKAIAHKGGKDAWMQCLANIFDEDALHHGDCVDEISIARDLLVAERVNMKTQPLLDGN